MPAFIINGPDIPKRLLEAHEEGKVIFFCGAGISYPANLPGFDGLVDQIYNKLHLNRTPIEEETYKEKQFDRTLDLLERRNPGKRLAVREALASVLDTSQVSDASTATHKALLQLATNKNDNSIRLVTTNFDRLFEHVITKDNRDIPKYPAPLLPIPKKSRWNGVVYLHGLLPTSPDENDYNRLVLTSGDFGLAYLTERWASRFVTELFQHYTVCFVGYSINDPVLRYMMDALAADELLGEARSEAFAFAGYETGKKEQTKVEWETKGVIPLLYEIPVDKTLVNKEDHSALHRTLKEWAATYKDGVQGKEMIIAEHASNPPHDSSKTDYAVGRVLWALTDWLAAKHFADLNPVPPLEWLGPLSERMGIVDDGTHDCHMDSVMFNLARWLTRHLNDPKLIIWLAENGGQLHDMFIQRIRTQLDELDDLAAKGKQEEINSILSNAPNAIPSPPMRILWELFISRRVKSSSYQNLHTCLKQIEHNGLTSCLRMELRQNLTPKVFLRAPFNFDENTKSSDYPKKIKNLVDWELVLSSNNVHHFLDDWKKKDHAQEALQDMILDFTMLLRDAMDLVRELEGANDHSDLSYIHQPSISDHSQNRDAHDWTALITLVRDSWLANVENNESLAKNVAENWWLQPYPIFKRLAMFAATYDNIIPQRQALDWLLEDNGWWLWSVETQRETMRLLVFLATRLTISEVNELEQVVLAGPPREMFNEDAKDNEWKYIVDKSTWLCLAKFDNAGGKWGKSANTKLCELYKEYPNWKLYENERDEFSFWMEEEGEWFKYSQTPQNCSDLVDWLKDHETVDYFEEDDWRQHCRDDFHTTSCALIKLAEENIWLEKRWKRALVAWSEDKINNTSWSIIGPVLDKAPPDIMQSISYEISWWLQVISKHIEGNDAIFLSICHRILEEKHNDETKSTNPLETAINRPVGLVTEALLRWCFHRRREDGQGLPEDIKPIFTSICDPENAKFAHGRVVLATRAVTLYRLDINWTKKNLLPLFDWNTSTEAYLVWEGFLWSPRLYRSFLADVKMELLEVATHYQELSTRKVQYAEFLTFIALDPGDVFTLEELAKAFESLPVEGLEHAARALIRAIDGAKDNREEYWDNRVLPYLHKVWPKNIDIAKSTIPDSFAELCVVAGEVFPKAFEELKYEIRLQMHSFYLFDLMAKKEICKHFPEESLSFLNSLVDDEVSWLPKEFQACLNEIEETKFELADDRRFIHLSELAKRYAIGY